MTRWIIAIGVGMLLMMCEMLFAAPDVSAQAPGGAFEQLSPGNQKIARSLFEAQRSDPPRGTRPLTLDEIAARKTSGEGWGRVFDGMKSEGRVTTKNLGQAVSSSNHRHHSTFSSGSVTTAANRTVRTAHVTGGGSGRSQGMAASAGSQGRGTVSGMTASAGGQGRGTVSGMTASAGGQGRGTVAANGAQGHGSGVSGASVGQGVRGK